MATLFQPSLYRATNSNGTPYSGAKMTFYTTGTTSLLSVYTSADGLTPLANPVVANSGGQFPTIYLSDTATYRIRLTDSTGAVILWDIDPIPGTAAGATATAAALTAAANGYAVAASASATTASNAAISAQAFSNGIYTSTASALSNGVQSTTTLVAGSGGTNGQFDVVFSGGGGSGAAARFVVAGGVLTTIVITSKGSGYTSAPTMSFAASTGLTGASATAVIGQLVPAGANAYFLVASSGNSYARLWKNPSGTAVDQGIDLPSLASLTDLISKTQRRSIPLPMDLAGHFWSAEMGQLFKADLSPVTAVGDAVLWWVPMGETLASSWTINAGGTYQQDENGVGYLKMVEALNNGTMVGTFNLVPNTYISAAMAKDTDSNSSGVTISNLAGTAGIAIGFQAGTAQAVITSSRSGSFPVNNSRYGACPLGVPVVLDFYLEAGKQSSWTNNSVRDVPDPAPLNAGVRSIANDWLVGDSFASSTIKLNLPTKGGTRYYGLVYMQGVLTLSNRRAANDWLMRLTRLKELKDNTYDMFAIIGDSIAMGVGDQLTSTTPAFGKGAQYLDTGCLIPLKDPMQAQWPDQVSNNGSFGPAFAKTWYDLTGTAACMINCANGTGVGLFASLGSVLYSGGWLGTNVMPVAARKVRNAQGDVNGRLRAAIAYVGTNDRGLGKTQNEMRDGYILLRDRCRTYFGVPDLPLLLISADTSSDGTEPQFAVVRAAQVAAAMPNNEGIYLVVTYQNYLASGHHAAPAGNVHLDQFANNDIGTKAATAAASVLLY